MHLNGWRGSGICSIDSGRTWTRFKCKMIALSAVMETLSQQRGKVGRGRGLPGVASASKKRAIASDVGRVAALAVAFELA